MPYAWHPSRAAFGKAFGSCGRSRPPHAAFELDSHGMRLRHSCGAVRYSLREMPESGRRDEERNRIPSVSTGEHTEDVTQADRSPSSQPSVGWDRAWRQRRPPSARIITFCCPFTALELLTSARTPRAAFTCRAHSAKQARPRPRCRLRRRHPCNGRRAVRTGISAGT